MTTEIDQTQSPRQDGRPAGTLVKLAGLLFIAAGVAVVCAMLGPGDPPMIRAAALMGVWLFGGWMPAAYLLGAIGWGLALRGVLVGRGTTSVADSMLLAACIGVSASLTITHALGVLGLLNPASAWIWTGVGLGALLLGLVRRSDVSRGMLAGVLAGVLRDRWCMALLGLGAGGVGVMLAASAMAPGAQWDSEYGGYDSLSYHLQLPAEWMDSGRITPLEHNVYSYLPGYMEAATVHMACLSFTHGGGTPGVAGIVRGSADGAMAPNLLALGMAVLAAWAAARFTMALLHRSGIDGPGVMRGGCMAGAALLLTPWVQAVGSMAYNETGVLALGGAALAASVVKGLPPARRGLLVAVLMGGAAGCKPTAVLFLAPACALFMAWSAPRSRWILMFSIGAAAGLLMLAPWMLRNTASGGNPVFPQATGLFGAAHWSGPQADAYRAGHTFDGTLADRVLMLVRPDPNASANAPAVARMRGLTNPQWALIPWLGLFGCAGIVIPRATRMAGLLLLAGIAFGLTAWVLMTHLQSRFLIPLVPLFAGGFGAFIGSRGANTSDTMPLSAHAGTAMLVAMGFWGVLNFGAQRQGRPNDTLALGSALFTGAIDLGDTTDSIPSAWINRQYPDGALLLIGDAAPLYYRRPIGYATVWDRNPLAEAMRETPGDPDAWTRSIRRLGYRYVLISYAELVRLQQSGWNDPLLTPDGVSTWTQRLGEPLRVWPDRGAVLFAIDAPAQTNGGTRKTGP